MRGEAPSVLKLVLFIVVVTAIVAALATLLITDYHRAQHERAREVLTRSVSDDAVEIARWLAEGYADAESMAMQAGMAERYLNWAAGKDDSFPQLLQNRIESEREIRGYDCVAMFTLDGEPFAAAPPDGCLTVGTACADFVGHAITSGAPVFNDHFHDRSDAWCVAWAAPVRQGEQAPSVGVMVYSTQMRTPVVELLGDEPLPFVTGQVALVRAHGAGFDIITSANGFDQIAMPEGPELHVTLAAEVAEHGQIVRSGQDEDGTAIIAAAQGVSGTEWFVASRVDRAEINAPVWRFGAAVALCGVLIVVAFSLAANMLRRTRIERQREREVNVELADALETRDLFLRNMSHELRTPLQSIMGFTSVMRAGMAGPVTEEQSRQLGMVDASAKRLLALVDDVLDFGRMRAHGVGVAISRFSSAGVAAVVAETMRPLCAARGLDLQLPPGDVVEMETDRDMVERVVLNLMSNAVKFTDEGHVSLAIRAESDEYVTFEVADTGRGIPADQMDHIMEDFHQVVQPGDVKPEGTGLGLAISRRMSRALGGELTATSQVGTGSVFRLRVPRVHPDARE